MATILIVSHGACMERPSLRLLGGKVDRHRRILLIVTLASLAVLAAFAGALWAGSGPLSGGLKTKPMDAQGPVFTWHEGDTRVSAWMATDEVALFMRRGAKLDTASKQALGEVLGSHGESLPGSNDVVVFLRTDPGALGTAAEAAELTAACAALEPHSPIRAVSPVFYRGERDAKDRMVPTGQIVVKYRATSSNGERAALADRYGLTHPSPTTFSTDTVVYRASNGLASIELSERLRAEGIVEWSIPDWWRAMTLTSVPNDPLFGQQWHLQNTGQGGGTAGQDINVVPAWDSYKGSADEVIAVVDEATEISHEDLSPNVLRDLCFDYVDGDQDPSPPSGSDENHGTACAGVAAARGDNVIGVSGVAPEARFVAYRWLGNATEVTTADAMTRDGGIVDIRSNSWEPPNSKSLQGSGPLFREALERGVTSGRQGKGCVYVFAAGNGGEGADSNFNGYANSRFVMAVAASDANGQQLPYSEQGANVFVNAPSGPPVGDDACVATAALPPQTGATQELLPFLRGFRDSFLNRSAAGRALIDKYYSFGPEMVSLVVASPVIRNRAAVAIRAWAPAFRSLDKGDGSLLVTSLQVDALQSFLDDLAVRGGASLRQAVRLEAERASLARFVGRPVGELWRSYQLSVASSSGDLPGITTTDRTGSDGYSDSNYTEEFNGTSASTPMVSGACALVLQANPALSWRDVRAVLAETATKNDPLDADWTTNGAGYHVNHKYGFGRVDVGAAVTTARSWSPLGPEVSAEGSVMPYTSIPDDDAAGIASSISLDEDVRVESVEVYLTVEHPAWGDLHVSLTSPEGTVSELAASGSRDDLNGYDNWCFSTVRSMGESSRGSWILRVADEYPVDVGRLVSWTVKAYGSGTATAAVTSFTPTSGPVGTAVTLTGTGFSGATAVAFSGTAATSFNAVSGTQITATVPAGATTGTIAVTTSGGTVISSATSFTVRAPAKPKIAKLKPASGKRRVTVTITGTRFGAKRGTSYVKFGVRKCSKYLSWSKTCIKCRVPAKAKFGRLKVRVTTTVGASNAKSFRVRR
jgi:subtilisin-like proprotein convertase family protein